VGELFDFTAVAKKDFLEKADNSPGKSGKHVPLLSLTGLGMGLTGSTSEKAKKGETSDGIMPIPTRTLLALVRAVDPNKVVNLVQNVYAGFLVGLCAALNENAAKFGLGIHLGDRIASLLLSLADKLMKKAESATDKALTEARKETTDIKISEQQVKESYAWARLGVRAVCSSAGVYAAWKLKDVAATWSCCHFGGVQLVRALFDILKVSVNSKKELEADEQIEFDNAKQGIIKSDDDKDKKASSLLADDDALRECAAFCVAAIGFMFHLRHLPHCKPPLPLLLGLPLTPLHLMERALLR